MMLRFVCSRGCKPLYWLYVSWYKMVHVDEHNVDAVCFRCHCSIFQPILHSCVCVCVCRFFFPSFGAAALINTSVCVYVCKTCLFFSFAFIPHLLLLLVLIIFLFFNALKHFYWIFVHSEHSVSFKFLTTFSVCNRTDWASMVSLYSPIAEPVFCFSISTFHRMKMQSKLVIIAVIGLTTVQPIHSIHTHTPKIHFIR